MKLSLLFRSPTMGPAGTLSALATLAFTGFWLTGCANEGADDGVITESSALTATLSGTISDTQNRPLQGVTVNLNGRTQATATTGASGTYSFSLNIPQASASWSIMPTRLRPC